MYKITKREEVLRSPVYPIPTIDKPIMTLIVDMIRTMKANGGCGLAAPQIGIAKALVIATIQDKYHIAFINPRITWRSEEVEKMEEGCLSCTERVVVERAKEIEVSYTSFQGILKLEKFKGIDARILQHEIDHLNGKLIVDYKEI